MALDKRLVQSVKRNLAEQTSDQLRKMLDQHDTTQFSEEAFEAARELLQDRAEGRASEPVVDPKREPATTPHRRDRVFGLIMLALVVVGLAVGYFMLQPRTPKEVQEFARLTKAREYKEAFGLVETDFTLLFGQSEWQQLNLYLKAPGGLTLPGFKDLPTGMKLTILAHLAVSPSWLDNAELDDKALFDALCRNVYARYGLFDHEFKVESTDSEVKLGKGKAIPIGMKGQPTRWFLVETSPSERKIAFASIAYAFDALIKKAMQDSGKEEGEFLRGELAKMPKVQNQ